MALNYQQAIAAARVAVPELFDEVTNTRPLDHGYEDESDFLLGFDLIDEDLGPEIGGPEILVNKETGDVQQVLMLDILDKFQRMTPTV